MSINKHGINWESDEGDEPNPLLLEEYKLIQGKIDKLGEDKFKVRSWCFTVLTGAAALMKFSGALEATALSPLWLVLFLPAIAAFHFIELRQRQIGYIIGLRAKSIELIWGRYQKGQRVKDWESPKLAWEIIRESRQEKTDYAIGAILLDKIRSLLFTKTNPQGFRAAPQKRAKLDWKFVKNYLIVNADNGFYLMQYFLVVLVLIAALFPHSIPPSPSNENTFTLKMGTNEFSLSANQARILTTNFTSVIQAVTNFQVITLYTTNYTTINIFKTNIIQQDKVK